MRQEFHIGDRVFTSDGKRGIIRSKGPEMGRIVYMIERDGVEHWYTAGQLRMATFLEYLFWPTGFGKTPWPLFGLIQAFCVAAVVTSALDEAVWVGIITAVVINSALVFGSWMNYTRRWV